MIAAYPAMHEAQVRDILLQSSSGYLSDPLFETGKKIEESTTSPRFFINYNSDSGHFTVIDSQANFRNDGSLDFYLHYLVD